ncbi:toll/interleukin-1 receptor domain-containing protein [Halalkalibacter okhensis]|uniref:toll/interleukin-1 receptor domain-containing protein n=1 Tax=Halalkalibacter okhensis TaxID=333138 RepID=UPI00068B8246|nr:toll/interleukin-1 receptor domain-containing protein [Halalkalibacter okhensis]
MSERTLINPTIFISYSWTTPDHEEWVVDLATRLMEVGIKVKLDKWDLKEGQDIFAFMESMVNSDEIDKVLIICDEGYKNRADGRQGGVGTETQIISPEVYKDVKQEKFIPVVAERDESGNDFIPSYIASRLYIDLSSMDSYEENLERLIRNIYKVPLHQKPKLGKPPEYLFKSEIDHSGLRSIIRKMRVALEKQPSRLKYIQREFNDLFEETLNEYEIEKFTNIHEGDQQILDLIDEMLPLKDDYVDVLEILCEADCVDSELIIDFFERVYLFTQVRKSGHSYSIQFDHYKFLTHELFLHTIAILIKNGYYTVITELINAEFFINTPFGDKSIDFTQFRMHAESFDIRSQRLNLNRVSLQADTLFKRTGNYSKEILGTDLLLYFISKAVKIDTWGWYPITHFYSERNRNILAKLLNRLKSKRMFEEMNCMFNFENEQELKDFINDFETESTGTMYSLPNIKSYIKADEVCTIP